jgi:hypothetical protein
MKESISYTCVHNKHPRASREGVRVTTSSLIHRADANTHKCLVLGSAVPTACCGIQPTTLLLHAPCAAAESCRCSNLR